MVFPRVPSLKSTVYLSGESLKQLYDLLEESFLNNNENFNRELKSATTVEGNVEER